MDKLEKLNADRKAKWQALHELEERFRARQDELRKEMDAKIMAEFGNTLTEARTVYYAADRAAKAAQGEADIATAKQKIMFPEGTVLVEWKMPWHGNGFSKTKRTGRIEILANDAKYLRSRYSSFQPGDIVVRYLKKDGKPSVKITPFTRGNWLPEGAEHPKAEKKS